MKVVFNKCFILCVMFSKFSTVVTIICDLVTLIAPTFFNWNLSINSTPKGQKKWFSVEIQFLKHKKIVICGGGGLVWFSYR